MQLLNNLALLAPNISQPPPDFMSADQLQQQQQSEDGSSSSSGLVSAAVVDAIVSYLASTFEGGDARMMDAAAPPVTPLSVDRLQVGALVLQMSAAAAALQYCCDGDNDSRCACVRPVAVLARGLMISSCSGSSCSSCSSSSSVLRPVHAPYQLVGCLHACAHVAGCTAVLRPAGVRLFCSCPGGSLPHSWH
jgi:hypothetical protein